MSTTGTTPQPRIIVGGEEWCALPDLEIPAIKARVDSGAKTSSLHAFNIRPFERGGDTWVRFEVHPLPNDRSTTVDCEARVIDQRLVKSSSGAGEKRYVVRTPLQYGDHRWDIELTLTNRDSMGYRMLLGREAMNGRILVDPAASLVGGSVSGTDIARLYKGQIQPATGLLIGVLGNYPTQSTQRSIQDAAEARGHDVRIYDIRHCALSSSSGRLLTYYRGELLSERPDAIIPRIAADMGSYGCALLRQFENMGSHCLNRADAIRHTHDPLRVIQLLQHAGLPMPATILITNPADIEQITTLGIDTPLVIQLVNGARSKQWLTQSYEAATTRLSALGARRGTLLVHRFIPQTKGRTLRLMVMGRRVVCAIERPYVFGTVTGLANIDTEVHTTRISRQERQLAIKAARATGLTVAHVDILRAPEGPLLLMVHSTPTLHEMQEACDKGRGKKNLAEELIRLVEKQLDWKPASDDENAAPAKARTRAKTRTQARSP